MKKISLILLTIGFITMFFLEKTLAAETEAGMVITTIEITGVDELIVGEALDTEITVTQNGLPSSGQLQWNIVTENSDQPYIFVPEPEKYICKEDEKYSFGIILIAGSNPDGTDREGYSFNKDSNGVCGVSVTINGEEPESLHRLMPSVLLARAAATEPVVRDNEVLKETVEETSITAKVSAKTGYNKVSWTNPEQPVIEKYQVYRSVKKSSGFKRIKTTSKLSYKDSKSLTVGKKYYYKVRGVAVIDGETCYTEWSDVIMKEAK